jgi:hypothetical protein
MRAHVIENGVVTNTIVVDSLDVFPNLIDADIGGTIGDLWDGTSFSKPPKDIPAEETKIRALRNNLLKDSDWTQLADSSSNKVVWAAYRQSLRDITKQAGFPWTVAWPDAP